MSSRGGLFVAFGGMGATASLVPAVLPLLAAQLGVPARLVLAAAPALFFGLLVGVLSSAVAGRLAGVAGTVRVGALVQFIGLAVLAVAVSPWMVFLAAVVSGFGFGLVEAGGTSLAWEIAGQAVARILALLTATVAVVAAAAPLVVVAVGAAGFRFVLAAAALAQLAAVLLVPAGRGRAGGGRAVRGRAVADVPPVSRCTTAQLVPIAIALFCYVGIESTLSGLSATTLQASLETSAALAALGTSAFWLLMTAGRMAGAAVLARGGRASGLAIGSLAVIAGLLLVAAAASVPPTVRVVLLAVAVLFCGPCYALLVGTASERMTARGSGTAVAGLIAVGAVGGTVVPAIVIAAGGVRSAAWIPAVFGVVAVLALALARTRTRTGEPRT